MGEKPLQQITRRLTEYESIVDIRQQKNVQKIELCASKTHYNGNLAGNREYCSQYKILSNNIININVADTRNNCNMLKNNTDINVVNIIKSNGSLYLIGKFHSGTLPSPKSKTVNDESATNGNDLSKEVKKINFGELPKPISINTAIDTLETNRAPVPKKVITVKLRKLDNLETFKAELQSVDKSADKRTKGFFEHEKFSTSQFRSVYSLSNSVHQKKWKVMLFLILPN
ncbi:uncharacterized protein LOC116738644 [Nasonia vitripennis]|uniref:Uncharacterized protein n=1 Tax=Nasonia vitripennis TaxID=7425 RepID=A0A7M7TEF2_NASVI|nr:uncharacterized protein LOC116738644 [Nasonia vitripennis]